MKERHWRSLVGALRHGDCILIVGPEIPASSTSTGLTSANSANSEAISLVEALRRNLARELEAENRRVNGSTLAAVAQQYEDAQEFGPDALRAAAEKFFRSGAYGPSTVHNNLAELPFSLILTTGQGRLLAEAMKTAGKEPIIQRYNLRGNRRDNPEFMIPGSPTCPVIYRLFGDYTEPSSLVLSENDLVDFLIAVVSERPPLPNSLLSALKRAGQNFLFVGFGICHWELRILLKVLLRAFELNRNSTKIAAEPLRGLLDSDREETILFYQRGTRVEVEDNDVTTFLSVLSEKLKAEGGFAGHAEPAGPRPRVFISYAHEDRDLASRVFDTLRKANFEPWLDRESLEGGDDWDRRIQDDLDATDFTLVLYTPTLSRKTDSYVNKEIALACNRALQVRGPFLIPLRTGSIVDADRVSELRKFDEMDLRLENFTDDMSRVISIMMREYQRRNR